jgi:putative thioredoxin
MGMGNVIDVNKENFASEVLERSHQQLVVVDFYAHWCGPCQLLKPILEKLTQEYDITLAKVDIDDSPTLATRYGVSGVPDVRFGWKGQLKPGFVGVQGEAQIHALLAQYGLQSPLDQELALIQAEQAAGNLDAGKERFANLIRQYPDRPPLMMAAATFLAQIGSIESAQKLLSAVPASDRVTYAQAENIRALIAIKQSMANLSQETEADRQYASALEKLCQADYEPALQGLLGLIESHRKTHGEAARKAMLVIFGLLGDEQPLTKTYRKQLMLVL